MAPGNRSPTFSTGCWPCSISYPSTPARHATSWRPWPRSWRRSLACQRRCDRTRSIRNWLSMRRGGNTIPDSCWPNSCTTNPRTPRASWVSPGWILFIPVLTHVFGEAQLDGPAAVVSAYRLDNQIYGLPPNRDLLLKAPLQGSHPRVGPYLPPGPLPRERCVMMSSTYVEGHRPEVGSLLHGLPQPCTEQRSVILSAAKNLASLAIQARFFASHQNDRLAGCLGSDSPRELPRPSTECG